jgi:hypothetical protein
MGEMDLRQFNRTFGQLIANASDIRKPLTEIGVLMTSEMKEDIRVQGRPEPWVQSQRAKREGGQTLRDTGTLMTGLIAEVGEKSVAAGPTMVGKDHITDPRVLELLAYGGSVKRYSRSEIYLRKRGANGRFKKGRSDVRGKGMTLGDHTANYPKRDYTYIPPESTQTFGEIMQDHLLR